jgi:membrane protease YdiL (CAAX protease family)
MSAPAMPGIVVRVRVLLLLLTVLLIPAVIAFSYLIAEDPALSDSDPESQMSFLGYTIAYIVLSIPLAALPPILSRSIGRGRSWARITAIVVLMLQGLFCSCFGLGAPLQITDGQDPALSTAYVFVGVVSFFFAVISIAVAIMLLMPKSNAFFRGMEQWRLATGAR